MFELKEIPISEITVLERARKDLGDIESLATDMSHRGLLYPLILNDRYELCEGGRRLEAANSLGWTTIEGRVIPDLSPEDTLVIEWLGNVSRKDFTWSEEVMLKLKIHEQCKEHDSTWSYRDTSKKLGVALGGLSTDLSLAAAIREIPELANYKTKGKAKEAYKKLASQAEAIQAYNSLSDEDQQTLQKYFSGSAEKANGTLAEESESDDRNESSDGESGVSPELSVDRDGERAEDPPSSSRSSSSRLPDHVYEICDFRDVLHKLPDGLVGFAELDPPYAIDFENTYGQSQDIETDFEDWTPEQLYENMTELLSALYSKLADDSWVLCWTGFEHALEMNRLARQAGFSTQRPGFWIKPSGATNNLQTNMISDYETFLLFRKGQAKFNTEYFKACRHHNSVPSAQKFHPTQKPIELYRGFFRAMGRPDLLFYCPFAGSGMSMITATFFSMTPIGTELTNKYYFKFLQWLKEYSYESAESQSSVPTSLDSD